jgi:hypothetical protein
MEKTSVINQYLFSLVRVTAIMILIYLNRIELKFNRKLFVIIGIVFGLNFFDKFFRETKP